MTEEEKFITKEVVSPSNDENIIDYTKSAEYLKMCNLIDKLHSEPSHEKEDLEKRSCGEVLTNQEDLIRESLNKNVQE